MLSYKFITKSVALVPKFAIMNMAKFAILVIKKNSCVNIVI